MCIYYYYVGVVLLLNDVPIGRGQMNAVALGMPGIGHVPAIETGIGKARVILLL